MSKIAFAKVSHKTLRELAYEELRRGFIAGKFAPGDAVTISELSKELGVGIMPTREAVQHLASQGAFEFLPNRSVRVPLYDIHELEQLYAARILNECYAAGLAAQDCDQQSSAHLRVLLTALEDAVKSRDMSAVQSANANFDFGIYQLCGNAFLFELIERLWLRMGPLYKAIWRDKDEIVVGVEGSLSTHWKLVELLEKNKAEEVKALVEQLLLISRDWVLSHHQELQLGLKE